MENLRNAFKKEEKIQILKKTEYDIYYSCTYKYPLLVVERINEKTGKTDGPQFGRLTDPELKNPWKMDSDIPSQYRLRVKNYRDYMEYGGSNGHNAPASYHKTTKQIYLETYKLSNCCPQEVVFNGTLWVLLENWVLSLQTNERLTDIVVYTGSIPAKKDTTFHETTINVPTHMFKVVYAIEKSTNTPAIVCFLMPNIRPTEKIHKIYKHIINIHELSRIANINFLQIFASYSQYNSNNTPLKQLKNIVRVDMQLSRFQIDSMHKANLFGLIIYSKNLEELKKNWEITKKYVVRNIEYHELYYKLALKRIKREMKEKQMSKKLTKKQTTRSPKKL